MQINFIGPGKRLPVIKVGLRISSIRRTTGVTHFDNNDTTRPCGRGIEIKKFQRCEEFILNQETLLRESSPFSFNLKKKSEKLFPNK